MDDDREVRDRVRDALVDAGYEVRLASNGLRLISALELTRPDLILLDVMMSWIDGFELCRAIKRNNRFASIPVAFMSGRTSPQDVERGHACGAVDYFPKPLDMQHLVARIRALVGDP